MDAGLPRIDFLTSGPCVCPSASAAPTLGRAGRKAAAVAIFHFKIGMLSILAACSFAGILLYFLGALG